MASMAYKCIPTDRCRLCQFDLDDDAVIVIDSEPHHSFPFRRLSHVKVPESQLTIHMCCIRSCPFGEEYLDCYHIGCYNISRNYPARVLLSASEYIYDPPFQVKLRRKNWIVKSLSANFYHTMPVLPDEIRTMIAKLLFREWAVVSWQVKGPFIHDETLDLKQKVYCTYITIDGIRYIKSLQNLGGSKCELLLDPSITPHVDKISVADDYLGIRRIQFQAPGGSKYYSQQMDDGTPVWWRQLSRPQGITELSIKTDGLKIRDLVNTACHAVYNPVRWPAPDFTVSLMDILTCQDPRGDLSHLRMNSLDCNMSKIIGYSAGCRGSQVTMHTHFEGEETSFYTDIEESFRMRLTWIYFPIKEGEFLSMISRRIVKEQAPALMFTTNLKRSCIFGPYVSAIELATDALRDIYASPTNEPFQFYYNDCNCPSLKRIDVVASNRPSQSTIRKLPASLDVQPLKSTIYNEYWFYSSAPLFEVVEIVPCIDSRGGYQLVLGALLRYCNGSQECLGQYRADFASNAIRVNGAPRFYVGIGRDGKGFSYVAKLSVSNPTEHSSLQWREISWEGRLEWWYSRRQSRLQHVL